MGELELAIWRFETDRTTLHAQLKQTFKFYQ